MNNPTCPPPEFSLHLAHFLRESALSLLTEWILNGEMLGWTAGGCRICAEGLCRWMEAKPDDLRRWGISEPWQGPTASDFSPPLLITVASKWYRPLHVAVAAGNLYLDGLGVATEAQLLARWSRYAPRLVAYHPRRLARFRIIGDAEASAELSWWLARRFGPFRPALLCDARAWSTPLAPEKKFPTAGTPAGGGAPPLSKPEARELLAAMQREGVYWKAVARGGVSFAVDRVDCQAAIAHSEAGPAVERHLRSWEQSGRCTCWDCASSLPEAAVQRRLRTTV